MYEPFNATLDLAFHRQSQPDTALHAHLNAIACMPGVSKLDLEVDPMRLHIQYDAALVSLAEVVRTVQAEGPHVIGIRQWPVSETSDQSGQIIRALDN